ncbi:zinc ribbon domain-containing protein [Clostridium transplantifaecale]|uniref:zinc ribbon domain-containing protein n=1 Tax=Clostridium transplantifaecale TaxID=2479838 RepID=UPI000F6336EB|nr:zinc ribbon domain-containing protein [Clostridium transplantifaecale]
MICPYCNNMMPDDSVFCSECGKRLQQEVTELVQDNIILCPVCGSENQKGSNFCTNCRSPLSEYALQKQSQQNELQARSAQLKMQAMSLKAQQEQLELQQQQYASMAKCPKCGSTSLSGNKKGFGIGKAVVGAALVGPLGLVAGNIGAKKVRVTCLNCGKKFML